MANAQREPLANCARTCRNVTRTQNRSKLFLKLGANNSDCLSPSAAPFTSAMSILIISPSPPWRAGTPGRPAGSLIAPSAGSASTCQKSHKRSVSQPQAISEPPSAVSGRPESVRFGLIREAIRKAKNCSVMRSPRVQRDERVKASRELEEEKAGRSDTARSVSICDRVTCSIRESGSSERRIRAASSCCHRNDTEWCDFFMWFRLFFRFGMEAESQSPTPQG